MNSIVKNPFQKTEYFQEKFSKLKPADTIFKKIEFEKCSFNNCTFQNITFKNCSFIECLFQNSNLSMLKIDNSSFSEAKFINCKMIGIDWTKTIKTVLPISLLFNECIVDLCSFNNLIINNFELIKSSAKEVDFRGATLINSNFSKTDLEKSLFHNTNLESSNFTQSKNLSINFKNNKIKNSTHSFPNVINLLNPLNIKIENIEFEKKL